jgi:AAA domain
MRPEVPVPDTADYVGTTAGREDRSSALPETHVSQAAMPMARNNCCRIPTFRLPGSPTIARARQSRIKLAANHLLAATLKDGARTMFSLQHDLAALGKKLKEVGDVAIVVIDPITSYMGSKIDSHRVTDVRAVLEPLADWAEEHKVAVLGITHPPKNAPAKAIHALGSIAYVAAARLVFLAIEEPSSERRLLLPVKNNLGPLAPGLSYALVQTPSARESSPRMSPGTAPP